MCKVKSNGTLSICELGKCESLLELLLVCVFFQAEDGIRGTSVTGVQTCALPILSTV